MHEGLENPLLVLGGDAGAGILDFDQQVPPTVVPHAQAEGHAALLGELHCVADQVDQNLSQASFIALDVARKRRGLVELEVEPLLFGAQAHHVGDVAGHATEVEGSNLQLQASGLDLGHLQHVVDQGQEVLAAAVDDVQALDLGAGQLRIAPHHAREAKNGVQRRAQLVAHVGQKY